MALQGTLAVLYYGIFASVTGGWLPVRVRNLWLVVFHLYLFLTFILFPLAVYLVSQQSVPGWSFVCVCVCVGGGGGGGFIGNP